MDNFDASAVITLLHAAAKRGVDFISIPEAHLNRDQCQWRHILARTSRPLLIKQGERFVCVPGCGMTEAQDAHRERRSLGRDTYLSNRGSDRSCWPRRL